MPRKKSPKLVHVAANAIQVVVCDLLTPCATGVEQACVASRRRLHQVHRQVDDQLRWRFACAARYDGKHAERGHSARADNFQVGRDAELLKSDRLCRWAHGVAAVRVLDYRYECPLCPECAVVFGGCQRFVRGGLSLTTPMTAADGWCACWYVCVGAGTQHRAF